MVVIIAVVVTVPLLVMVMVCGGTDGSNGADAVGGGGSDVGDGDVVVISDAHKDTGAVRAVVVLG